MAACSTKPNGLDIMALQRWWTILHWLCESLVWKPIEVGAKAFGSDVGEKPSEMIIRCTSLLAATEDETSVMSSFDWKSFENWVATYESEIVESALLKQLSTFMVFLMQNCEAEELKRSLGYTAWQYCDK